MLNFFSSMIASEYIVQISYVIHYDRLLKSEKRMPL